MDRLDIVQEWLNRAKSNLAKAKTGRDNPDIYLEDLCFDAQQAIEKSLKAFLIFLKIDFPKTHSIGDLLTLLIQNKIVVSDKIKESARISYYAVTTRYPGDWEPVASTDYEYTVNMAEKVFYWVQEELIKRGWKINE